MKLDLTGLLESAIADFKKLKPILGDAATATAGLYENELRSLHEGPICTLPARFVDDLIRTVGIIALSGNTFPHEPFTKHQHEACVERCQSMMKKYDLYQWTCETKEQ